MYVIKRFRYHTVGVIWYDRSVSSCSKRVPPVAPAPQRAVSLVGRHAALVTKGTRGGMPPMAVVGPPAEALWW